MDNWVAGTGTSLIEERKSIQRARTVAALIGSYASTPAGLTSIAQIMDYNVTLEQIVPARGVIGPRFDQLRCGGRIWGTAFGLHRKLSISSSRADFKILKERVDSQRVAHFGTLHCGERLWQTEADIQAIVDVSLYEIQTIESLLPAHFIVLRVLE